MWENKWEDLKEKHTAIREGIASYNERIKRGDYSESPDELDIKVYYNLLVAHIVALLKNDSSLYIPEDVISTLNLGDSDVHSSTQWVDVGNGNVSISSNTMTNDSICQLSEFCFNDRGQRFIQELCAQDLVSSGKIAKDIESILGLVALYIIVDAKDEDEIFRLASEVSNGGGRNATVIEKRYTKECSKRSILIHNRIFQHNYSADDSNAIITLPIEEQQMLNYKEEGLYCQTAVFHIGVETTSSSGTGFFVSEDGYALTCAHVVEGATEICANVICNDGYPVEGFEHFGVYDVPHFGKVVYQNDSLDIALLKMDDCVPSYLPIEQRRLLPEIGEEVVVLGYPLGYEMPQTNKFGPNISLYKGYVSSNQVKDGNSVTFLDIDVKSGNSGSPVISVKTGKVIGIISGIKVGGRTALTEKMPYMIPIQHFLELNKKQ